MLLACASGCGAKEDVTEENEQSGYSVEDTTESAVLQDEETTEETKAAEDDKTAVAEAAPEDLRYQYYAELGGVVINGYSGEATAVTFPKTIDGDEVKGIKLVGVTSIEPSTFYGCSSLINVTLPEGLTKICDGAFMGCNNLRSLEVPDGVEFEERSFSNCFALTVTYRGNSYTSANIEELYKK